MNNASVSLLSCDTAILDMMTSIKVDGVLTKDDHRRIDGSMYIQVQSTDIRPPPVQRTGCIKRQMGFSR